MTQGMVISLKMMVTSLKMMVTEMGDRGSKSTINNGVCVVKEQRVDSSENSRILDFVRCTLVAGKPVFGRKIHSHSNNSGIVNNIFKRSIYTTRSSLDP